MIDVIALKLNFWAKAWLVSACWLLLFSLCCEGRDDDLERRNNSLYLSRSLYEKSFDCNHILQPIREKRESCFKEHPVEINMCTFVAGKYRYLNTFLIHHLSLGIHKIWLYNNDEKLAWYLHPTVVCLVSEGWVGIHPWHGDAQQYPAMENCHATKVLIESNNEEEKQGQEEKEDNDNKKKDKDRTSISDNQTPNSARSQLVHEPWFMVFDINQFLVLPQHTCLPVFIAEHQHVYSAIPIHWQMFVPKKDTSTLSLFGLSSSSTTNAANTVALLTKEQLALLDYRTKYSQSTENNDKNNRNDNSDNKELIVLPPELLIHRLTNPSSSTTTYATNNNNDKNSRDRTQVFSYIMRHHCLATPSTSRGITIKAECHRAHTHQNTNSSNSINDNNSHKKTIQLNHYIAASMQEFLYRIHQHKYALVTGVATSAKRDTADETRNTPAAESKRWLRLSSSEGDSSHSHHNNNNQKDCSEMTTGKDKDKDNKVQKQEKRLLRNRNRAKSEDTTSLSDRDSNKDTSVASVSASSASSSETAGYASTKTMLSLWPSTADSQNQQNQQDNNAHNSNNKSEDTQKAFQVSLVEDLLFLQRYSGYFQTLKIACPVCFDNKLHHPSLQQ